MIASPPPTRGSGLRATGSRRPLLLVLSHLRWNFVLQRPQHLMVRAAKTHDVLFWEEPVWTDAVVPELRLSRGGEGIVIAVPALPHGTDGSAAEVMQRRLLDQFLQERQQDESQLILWFYTPMALGFADHLRPARIIYDCMDELSAFRGAPPGLLDREADLLRRADLVFTGGRSLFRAKRNRHHSVHCFPSSIDVPHFAQARGRIGEAPDQAALPRPRLGFFGVIDERMDLDLLGRMAALRPAWQFVMIGPVVKIDPASLPARANIHWLGARHYDQLPAYLVGWDLGFMPFALNESTRFISPTKTPEFLAAGLPLISTPVADVVHDWGRSGLVQTAASADEMIAAAEFCMRRPRDAWLQQVDTRLAGTSWDRTWAGMLALIRQRAAGLPRHEALATQDASHV